MSGYLQITYNVLSLHSEPVHCGMLPFCDSELFMQSITNHLKLTSGDDVKPVYDVTIDTTDINYAYHPGDAIGIITENNPYEIHALMDLLQLQDCNYELSILENAPKKNAAIPTHIPAVGSIKHLFKECLDIRSIPKKAFLKMLAQYTSNQEEKDTLLLLSMPNEEKYNSFIENDGRTLLTLLQKFPTCRPSLERLLEHLPALKPRFYSISSSSEQSFNITFSVIEYGGRKGECGEVLLGVCSSYLQRLLLNKSYTKKIRFYFRQSTNFLSFNAEFKNPLILIGPGTGVAPFRGFLHARAKSKLSINKIFLFFGCRYTDRDFLYKDELLGYAERRVLTQLYTAFSRDAPSKVYVQDRIKEQGKLVVDLILNENAYLRLCGDAKNLTKSIDDALRDILLEHGELDHGECNDFLVNMKVSGRYSIDVWI